MWSRLARAPFHASLSHVSPVRLSGTIPASYPKRQAIALHHLCHASSLASTGSRPRLGARSLRFHNRKCILHAAVIMPDHVHLILTPLADEEGSFSIPQIMHATKSESAHRINKALGRKGRVWQDESFDHMLRGDESLTRKMSYVLENPVRAGLVKTSAEYRWLWRQPEAVLRTA